MKLMCLECRYIVNVEGPKLSEYKCERCESLHVQLIPDDAEITTITGAANTDYKVASTDTETLASRNPVLSCYGCGLLYQEALDITGLGVRGNPCPSCGSGVTRIIKFDNVKRDRKAENLAQEGEDLYRSGDYGKAIERFEEALELAPDHPNLLLDMGNALAMLGWNTQDRSLIEQSVEYLTKALQLFPTFDRAKNNLTASQARLTSMGRPPTPFESGGSFGRVIPQPNNQRISLRAEHP